MFTLHIITYLLLCLVPDSPNQSVNLTVNEVRAAYLYNFVKFVSWPDHVFDKSDDPIVIGFWDSNEVEKAFHNIIKGRTINSRTVDIRLIESLSDVIFCNVIYMNGADKRHQVSVVNLVRKKPILTVSDEAYFSRIGGMIQFYFDNNQLKFEINRKALSAVELEVSARLLRVARVIE